MTISRLVAASVALLATAVGLLTVAPAAQAARTAHAAPGSLTGYGFDTCSAPAQTVMDAWREESPYSAVGVYIGGANRRCAQPELSAGWVHTQVKHGWHVLALWVGPQASCSGYPEVMSSDTSAATQQGRDEAASAVAAAGGLGIGAGGTLYYDLEDYDIAPDDCRRAALSFLSGWTQALHAAGYHSGVYSNIAAAITSLDYADRVSPGSYEMPDDIWFGWANGRADAATDDRVQSSRWDDHARVHQYAIDEEESYGGYSMVVDQSWADVGAGSTPPRERKVCPGVDVDLRHYPALTSGRHGPAVTVLQCLLRTQHFLKGRLTGRFDAHTLAAVRKAKVALNLTITLHTVGRVTGPTWAALLARGSSPLLKVGATGSPVFRLQRALTAAGVHTPVTGLYSKKTARAVRRYQRHRHLEHSGVVTDQVWHALLQR